MTEFSDTGGGSLSDALEIVHEAASEVWLDPGEEWMLDGIETFGDFVGNHHEKIDDLYSHEDLANQDGHEKRVSDLLDDVASRIDHDLDRAFRAAIEAGARQLNDAPDPRLARALGVSAAFWADAGRDICADTASVRFEDGPAP